MHAFMQYTNRDATIPIIRFAMLILSFYGYAVTHFDSSTPRSFGLYVLASYLNKVRVSFLWAGYGLSLHAGSEDCSYFYKDRSDIQ